MRLRLDVSTDAQHDGPEGVIPSEAEESRGNDFFLIPRGRVLLVFGYSSTRAEWFRSQATLSPALRLLGMTR